MEAPRAARIGVVTASDRASAGARCDHHNNDDNHHDDDAHLAA